jgi:serine phosphatase RsbU (regulator of sigma subunit)
VRPLLEPGTAPAQPAPWLAAWRYLLGSWPGRVLLAAFALVLVEHLLGAAGLAFPRALSLPARIVLWSFLAWLAWRGLRWASARLLWRIRTKLIVSYLFIALVPVLLLSVFMALAGMLLVGLVASRIVSVEVERTGELLRATARSALVGLPGSEADASAALGRRLAGALETYPGLRHSLLRGGKVVASTGGPRALPAWLREPGFAGLVPLAPQEKLSPEVVRGAWTEGDATLVLDVPADDAFYAEIEERTGIHVIRRSEIEIVRTPRDQKKLKLEDGMAVELEEQGTRLRARSDGGGFIAVAFVEKTDWASGERSALRWLPLVFRYQPLNVVRRLSPVSLRELGMRSVPEFLLYLLGVLAAAFVAVYALALVLGLLLARQITRGVHDLSLGTQRLRQGDFSHTIRVRSRDQLGELAESFNLMSRGLQALMQEQAERQRLEEELRIARQIQMSLLPEDGVVRLPGVRVAALCLPAAEVGGDYYDLLPLSDSRMGVLVADVSGKGTSAALYMAELKGLVLSLSRIYDSPARLLGEANRILSAHLDARSFVTMTYAVVDTAARRMRYARAGHNPLIRFEARTGLTQVLTPAGLGLGLDPGEAFERILEEAELPLEPGDFILFFTDGLSEAMNAGAELFGEARLRRILERGVGLDSDEMKERILAEVRGFVGEAAPHDDLTLVVLKVVEEASAA